MVVTDAPAELTLQPLNGEARTLREWLTNFHLALFVIDPYTNESAWLLPTMTRVMREFADADVRVAFAVTADAADANAFLGPLAVEFLTFTDPARRIVAAVGLERLPAFVHIRTDLSLAGVAQGWRPSEWRVVAQRLANVMSWAAPQIPLSGDPAAFEGSAAAG